MYVQTHACMLVYAKFTYASRFLKYISKFLLIQGLKFENSKEVTINQHTQKTKDGTTRTALNTILVQSRPVCSRT